MSNLSNQDYFLSYLEENELSMLAYLLKKLGFYESQVLKNYVKELGNPWLSGNDEDSSNNLAHAARMVLYGIKKEHDFRANKKIKQENQAEGRDYRTIIDFLLEYKIRDYVTASDIVNYIFCPVRYCIARTFAAEGTDEAKKGTHLHAQHRLAYYAVLDNEFSISYEFVKESIRNKDNEKFFEEIRSSKILYVGHEENSKKYFVSKKGKFVGQPDYVFENSNGEKFIVEEKFRAFSDRKTVLQSSHRAQIASYIMGINEFDAKYGYVVYWYYAYEREYKREYESKYFTVKKCDVFRVDKSLEIQQEIRSVYKSIISLNSGDEHEFEPGSLNAKKCVKCAVRMFCGHKTGRFQAISVPYSKEHYTLISGGFNGWGSNA
ncbi:MAG: hypothetical protein EOO61_10730 [Hymenobacter sp.]|nr:MAG: hypothetical protein EOO61_10730 [Hymenobacter sp.]